MARALRALALLLVVASVHVLRSAPAAAQLPELDRDAPVEITADRIEYDREREIYVAEGHVHVVQQGKSLRARWATFSGRTRLGVASGDVRYRDETQLVEARFVQFDVDSLDGVVFGGEMDLGELSLRIAAEELVRTGEDTYRILDARITTCRCPDPEATPPWELRAGRSDVEIGGYGTSRNTTLEVVGVPVVWLPWIMYPVKTERQTGLLPPKISAGGRNGFAVAQPFFWAARHDLNVTVTPGYSEDRGYKGDLEIETVHGERGVSRSKGGFAWDEDSPSSGNRFDPNEDVGTARGFVELAHYQELPGAVQLRLDGRWVSDNQYMLDFNDLQERRRDRFLESVGFAHRHFAPDGRFGVQLAGRYADDLQSSDYDDRDPYLLQRYADLEAEWLSGPVAGLQWLGFGVGLDYEYFGREDGPLETFRDRGYLTSPAVLGRRSVDVGISAIPQTFPPEPPVPADDTRGDGLYQEGEPLFDTGHRATIHPRVSVPLRLFDRVEWSSEAGWMQTLYYSEQRDFEERGLVTARSDLQIRLARRYDIGRGQELEHRMVPRLSWAFISRDSGQERNPLFTPQTAVTQYRLRQRALDNVLRDPADVIPATNRLVASLDHRLYRYAFGRRVLMGELGMGLDYDFADGGRLGRLVVEGRRIRVGRTMNRLQVSLDARKGKIDEVFTATAIQWPWRIATTFGYRFVPDGPDFFENFQTAKFRGFSDDFDDINQITAAVSFPLLDRFRVRYRANYSFAGSFFLTNSGSIDYVSRCECWAAGIQLRQSRDEKLRFQFRYTVVGLGDDPDNPFSGRGWFQAK